MTKIKTFFGILWNFRSSLLLFLFPILLLPIPLVLDNGEGKEAACGYCIIVMSAFWISEVLPLAVTSFLPLILFPMMGIMPAASVGAIYIKDISWIFIGGLTTAVAIEHTNLHKRLALAVLLFVGTKPHSLMLGFMLPTYFLSMWITNTATTAMMIPIVSAVIGELKADQERRQQETKKRPSLQKSFENEHVEETAFFENEHFQHEKDKLSPETQQGTDVDEDSSEKQSIASTSEGLMSEASDDDKESRKEKSTKLGKGLTLCVPYAATLGGISTVTGSVPNLVLAGLYSSLFPYADPQLTFSKWIAYHLPLSLTFLLLAYIWLMWLFVGLECVTLYVLSALIQHPKQQFK